jgi:hypothetical protein
MAIKARLVHPCENPSAVMPTMVPANDEITASIKPSAAKQINPIEIFPIALLLLKAD